MTSREFENLRKTDFRLYSFNIEANCAYHYLGYSNAEHCWFVREPFKKVGEIFFYDTFPEYHLGLKTIEGIFYIYAKDIKTIYRELQ